MSSTTPAPRQAPSLARSSMLMASGSMVSRVLGLVRNMLMAYVIGTALAADAFNVANTVPNYIYLLLSAGLLNAILVPQITKAMKQHADGGQEFVDRLLTACFGMLALATAVATVASPLLLRIFAASLSGRSYDLALLFAYVCVPQLFFYGINAVLGQVLNARDQFAAFMWSPVLANVVQIIGMGVFVLVYHRQPDPAAWTQPMVWLFGGAYTLGVAAQGLVLFIPLLRGGFHYRPKLGLRGYGLRAASKMAGWAFAALVVSQIGGIAATQVMFAVRANHPDVPGLTTQQLAFMMFMLPHGLITTSIITALFPRMSRAANDQDVPELRRNLVQGLTLPAVAIIPATFALVVLAVPTVGAMFPGQPLGVVRDIALVTAIMSIGLLAFGITTLQQRFYFAVEDGRTNLQLQVLLTGVQIVVCLVALVGTPHYAVAIVAFAQTLANTVAALAFVANAHRRVGGLSLYHVTRLYVRLAIASVGGAVVAGILAHVLYGFLAPRWIVHVLVLAVAGTGFLLCFVALARVFRITEVDDLLSPLVRRLRRRSPAAPDA